MPHTQLDELKHTALNESRGGKSSSCARDCVRGTYPEAHAIRGLHGWLIATDDGQTRVLGRGGPHAYWQEEAWINAVEEMEGLTSGYVDTDVRPTEAIANRLRKLGWLGSRAQTWLKAHESKGETWMCAELDRLADMGASRG